MDVLVTGDIVRDCHLYGGVKNAATAYSEPGTVYVDRLGGASLTCDVVKAAADAQGLAWDTELAAWKVENQKRQTAGKKPKPRPDNLLKIRPPRDYKTALGLTIAKRKIPAHLHSYGVWTDQAARKGAKDCVWRVERHFGYGPTEPPGEIRIVERKNLQDPPALVVLDDGNIVFRHRRSEHAWPDFTNSKDTFYLLKTSGPLCRGELWSKLDCVKDRLIVVLTANDLRRENAQINTRLSWEQCTEQSLHALQNHPSARSLLAAAHVIVNFGSEGALWVRREPRSQAFRSRLLFDPVRLEGDYSLEFDGAVYGYQTCLVAAIAHHLAQRHANARDNNGKSPFLNDNVFDQAMRQGIVAGLNAQRRLLELGHGEVRPGIKHRDKAGPGFPVQAVGAVCASSLGGFVDVEVPGISSESPTCRWTILAQPDVAVDVQRRTTTRIVALAQLIARHGLGATSHVPALRIGKLFTVDRSEIESFRTLAALFRSYESAKAQKRPLSIGVFGPPGSGKSFGVKALTEACIGPKAPFLEFNLAQFKGPEDLIGAFHRVRDEALKGVTPVVFWDEFDSQQFKWLQYLLAPMQDGTFQEGQFTRPVGKCIFIFAGGTSFTVDEFGVQNPREPDQDEMAALDSGERQERRRIFKEDSDRFRAFQLVKGPDFVSRLDGFLNVLGPNPNEETECLDTTWPIRRALILRSILGLKDHDELDIDPGLLYALLLAPKYLHGARSFEKIVKSLAQRRDGQRLHRSALPPRPLLDRETCADAFHAVLAQRDIFLCQPDLEDLAKVIHSSYLEGAKESEVRAQEHARPELVWTLDPSVQKAFDELDEDKKAANRAAARRVSDHLALIDFAVTRRDAGEDDSWKKPLSDAIERHVDLLAMSEHLGWCAERIASGWTYGKDRDDALKRHPSLLPWAQLAPQDQDKDRKSVRSIPDWLLGAGLKAAPRPADISLTRCT